MLLAAGIFLTFGVPSISALLITASDLPECAVECYCLAGAKTSIPVTDYERQCRSAPFQIHLRECAAKACTEEEFDFVFPFKSGSNYRLNCMQRNIVLDSE